MIKAEIFVDQCEFSGLWQEQVLIQQQACILSAALMALHTTLTPLAPSGTFTGAGDNEMSQRRQSHTGLILVVEFIKVNGSEEGLISWRDTKRQTQQQVIMGCILTGGIIPMNWASVEMWVIVYVLIFILVCVCL